MPTYQYECLECKHAFDVFQPMTAEPISSCEKCRGKVRKLFNSTGIIFKGKGFYVNDYKKNSSSNDKAPSPACAGCSAAGGCPSSQAE